MHIVIGPVAAVLLLYLYLWTSAKPDIAAKGEYWPPAKLKPRPYVERLAEWKRHRQPS